MNVSLKKTLFAALIGSMVFFGCNRGKIADLEKRNKSLFEQTTLQDSLLNDFMVSFKEFEDNLQLIKEKESLISMETDNEELQPNQKDRILEDIQMINDLLDQNRNLIEELSQKVDASDGKIGEFRRLVSRMKKDLEQKDVQIVEMKDQLATLNFEKEELDRQVDTLRQTTRNLIALNTKQEEEIVQKSEAITMQEETITQQKSRINTAYFVAGTVKELKERDVLSKEGGFVGIGKTARLKSDFNPSAFTKVDITEFEKLAVDSKKANLITNHPTDSYMFEESEDGKIASLQIKDPDRFWQTSKYLVVVLN